MAQEAISRPAARSIPRWCFLLAGAVAPLLLLATLGGLLVPGLYRDNAWVVPQNQTQDLFLLVVALPILLVALVGAARGSLRALLVLLGCLGYVPYGYLHYALGIRYNQLFLVYVALVGVSLYALIAILAHLDVERLQARFGSGAAGRPVRLFLYVAGGLVFLAWLADVVLALLAGVVPATIAQAQATSGVTYVLDMGILVPACYLAAVWLGRRQPWGYVLAGMLLVATTFIDVVGVPLSVVMGAPGPAAIMAVLALVGLAVTVLFFRAIREA